MSFMDRLKGRGRKDRDAAQHEDSSLSGPYSGLEADLRDTVQDSGLGTTVSVPDAIISEASPSVLAVAGPRRVAEALERQPQPILREPCTQLPANDLVLLQQLYCMRFIGRLSEILFPRL